MCFYSLHYSWDGGGGIHDIDSEGGGGGSGAGGSSERSGAGPTANQKKPRYVLTNTKGVSNKSLSLFNRFKKKEIQEIFCQR